MREMASDQHVAIHGSQAVANPPREIVGLQIASGGKLRQRIARAPKRFGGLPRAQLAAVPDDCGLRAARSRLGRYSRDVAVPALRKWPTRVDLRADRVTVMD